MKGSAVFGALESFVWFRAAIRFLELRHGAPIYHKGVFMRPGTRYEITSALGVFPPPEAASWTRPAPICLELSGDGVLDVPASERRIGPVSVADQPMFLSSLTRKV